MALGDSTRALIITAKAKGWDPTKIEGGESIANFDKQPDRVTHKTTGELPQGIHDSYPEDHPAVTSMFDTPGGGDDSRSKNVGGGGDPHPGMPGAE